MIIGVPKEIKPQENRIGAVPAMVLDLVEAGNQVLVERGGGLGAGIADDEYAAVGATIVDAAADVYGEAEMIIKVKEPLTEEGKSAQAIGLKEFEPIISHKGGSQITALT